MDAGSRGKILSSLWHSVYIHRQKTSLQVYQYLFFSNLSIDNGISFVQNLWQNILQQLFKAMDHYKGRRKARQMLLVMFRVAQK